VRAEPLLTAQGPEPAGNAYRMVFYLKPKACGLIRILLQTAVCAEPLHAAQGTEPAGMYVMVMSCLTTGSVYVVSDNWKCATTTACGLSANMKRHCLGCLLCCADMRWS
jgi:hypothetical protein